MSDSDLPSADLKTIAIFGGSFDPVHNGHINSALELRDRLSLNELRFMPCHQPAHKHKLACSSEQRLAMLKLAVAEYCGGHSGNDSDNDSDNYGGNHSGLLVDDREIKRDGISYAVETLEQLRSEFGDDVSLIWVMGTDSFAGLDSWYRWRDLLSLAHIVVMTRPDASLPDCGPVADLMNAATAKNSQQLKTGVAGLIWFESLSPYPISASDIRKELVAINELKLNTQNPGKLVNEQGEKRRKELSSKIPKTVMDYIDVHQLYC